MAYDADRHRRHSFRLRYFDYARAGAYYVTICTEHRECLFGEVLGAEMHLNELGRLVESSWNDLPRHYRNLRLDSLVVMPNHVHAILILLHDEGPDAELQLMRRTSLSEIVRGFKTFSARGINANRSSVGRPVWQRNYYEHRIRSDDTWMRIREYIAENPRRWSSDPENPHLTRNAK